MRPSACTGSTAGDSVPTSTRSRARDPQTFKRVYRATPTGRSDPVLAEGFEYRLLGLIPTTRHLIGVDGGLDAGKTISSWARTSRPRPVVALMYSTRISLTIGLFGSR